MRPLLYRWFVEYNPVYLLSATLVLGGCFTLSQGLVEQHGAGASLLIASIAEVYAAALIGGAALLTRIGLRRPAVMLALLAVLYQWDTTLHLETCVYLGVAGAVAAAAWLAIFVAKAVALAWALRVRLAREALAAAIVAAGGLAVGPWFVHDLGAHGAGAALAGWVFALGALYVREAIRSAAPLDAWGEAVLARATRAAWTISGALAAAHVAVAWREHAIALGAVAAAPLLLVAARARSEARAWALIAAVLAASMRFAPGTFFATAALAGAALLLRAYHPRSPPAASAAKVAVPDGPYRAGGRDGEPRRSADEPNTSTPRLDVDARARAGAGAIVCAYLAAWTIGWTHGAWPAHAPALDLALIAGLAAWAWRCGRRTLVAPAIVAYAHALLEAHPVPAPRSRTEWGALAVASGFALLAAALAATYRWRFSVDASAGGRSPRQE